MEQRFLTPKVDEENTAVARGPKGEAFVVLDDNGERRYCYRDTNDVPNPDTCRFDPKSTVDTRETNPFIELTRTTNIGKLATEMVGL